VYTHSVSGATHDVTAQLGSFGIGHSASLTRVANASKSADEEEIPAS